MTKIKTGWQSISSVSQYSNPDLLLESWLAEEIRYSAVKNKDVYELNNIIQSSIQSQIVTYKSVDIDVKVDEAVNNPIEYLN